MKNVIISMFFPLMGFFTIIPQTVFGSPNKKHVELCTAFTKIYKQAIPKMDLRIKKMTHVKSKEMLEYMRNDSTKIVEKCKNIHHKNTGKMFITSMQLSASILRPYLLTKDNQLSTENSKLFSIINKMEK